MDGVVEAPAQKLTCYFCQEGRWFQDALTRLHISANFCIAAGD